MVETRLRINNDNGNDAIMMRVTTAIGITAKTPVRISTHGYL
jgi:hypothetical protein